MNPNVLTQDTNLIHTREFSQIENVDVGVNVDVGSHPMGTFTPQNF